ncbi:hypothetical protein HDU96_002724 [Phlyctochytrium bullatum]|nr:hypothetical protein HDU96_002724 [Phlyctochytrium bullatum]
MFPKSPSRSATPAGQLLRRRCNICNNSIKEHSIAHESDCGHTFHRSCLVPLLRSTVPIADLPHLDDALQSLGKDRISDFICPHDACSQPLTFIRAHQAPLTAALVSQVTPRSPDLTGIDDRTPQSTRQCFVALQRLRPFDKKQEFDVTAIQGICVLLASLFDSQLYDQLLDSELGKEVFESRAKVTYGSDAKAALKRFHRMVGTHPFLHRFGGVKLGASGEAQFGAEAPWIKDESQLAQMASEFLGLAKAFFIQGKMWETGRRDLKRSGDTMSWSRFICVLNLLDVATKSRSGSTVPQKTPVDMLQNARSRSRTTGSMQEFKFSPSEAGTKRKYGSSEPEGSQKRGRLDDDEWIRREEIAVTPEMRVEAAKVLEMLEGTGMTGFQKIARIIKNMRAPGECLVVHIPRTGPAISKPASPFDEDESEEEQV